MRIADGKYMHVGDVFRAGACCGRRMGIHRLGRRKRGKNPKTKEHAIRCKLTFDGMDEVAIMEKTQYSGGSAYAEFKKLSRAPWTLDSVEFENPRPTALRCIAHT